MTRLVLTSPSGYSLMLAERADLVIPFTFRFVWGRVPSESELASYLAARSDQHGRSSHWSDFVGRWRSAHEWRKDLGLIEFCEPFKTIELWFDPQPNDQLLLVWLLDYLSSHPETAAKLQLRLIDFDLIEPNPEELGRWKVPTADVGEHELQAARMA